MAQDIKAELASMGISPDHVFGPKRRRHHVRVIDLSHQDLTARVETDTNDHASLPPVTAIAAVNTPACICVLHAMDDSCGSYEKGRVGNSGFLPRRLHRTPDRHGRLPRGWCRGQRGVRVIGTLRQD